MGTFKKIAVLKPSALGDFIFCLPALNALRETFPEAEITYLGKRWHKDFLSKRKSPLSRVVEIPPCPGVGWADDYKADNKVLNSFIKKMQRENYDLAIQLYGGGRFSNPFLLKLGAKKTIGTKTPDAKPLDKTIPYQYYQSEYSRWLEVVSLVGAKTASIAPKLEATTEDIKEAKRALGPKRQQIIILHPGATDKRRRWPVNGFIKVGNNFSLRGYRIIVTGSGDEKETVRSLVLGMKGRAEDFYGRLSLNGLTGLLSLSELLISNDTGPLHLADALGVKTVGLYWCGNLINSAPFFRKHSICLGSWQVKCPHCNEDCASGFPFMTKDANCNHGTSFIKEIKVEDIIRSGETLLGLFIPKNIV